MGGDDVWIGLNDIATEGTFRWVNGRRLVSDEIQWWPRQPDNTGNNEDCVHINHHIHPSNEANDLPCNHKVHALCEKLIQVQ